MPGASFPLECDDDTEGRREGTLDPDKSEVCDCEACAGSFTGLTKVLGGGPERVTGRDPPLAADRKLLVDAGWRNPVGGGGMLPPICRAERVEGTMSELWRPKVGVVAR